MKSLKEFKNIKESTLLENYFHNVDTTNRYSKRFKEVLDLKVKILDVDDSEEDEGHGYIINVIRRVVGKVQYRMLSRTYTSGRKYRIVEAD